MLDLSEPRLLLLCPLGCAISSRPAAVAEGWLRTPGLDSEALKGTDPEMYESFRSYCLQDYGEYEIIFGVSDANDPAVALVEKLNGISRAQNSIDSLPGNTRHQRESQQSAADAGPRES